MAVSLFMREWIEIYTNGSNGSVFVVSLFTREWIEIQVFLLSCGGGGSNANNLSDIGIYPA